MDGVNYLSDKDRKLDKRLSEQKIAGTKDCLNKRLPELRLAEQSIAGTIEGCFYFLRSINQG